MPLKNFIRKHLPDERPAVVHDVSLVGEGGKVTDLNLIAGMYPDSGALGELFLKAGEQGSTIAGFMQVTSVLLSLLLQYGVPPHVIAGKLLNMRFVPSGNTGGGSIKSCTSLVDYVAQWLLNRFPEPASDDGNSDLS